MFKIGDMVMARLSASSITYSVADYPFRPDCWGSILPGKIIGITDNCYVIEFDEIIYCTVRYINIKVGAHNYYGKGKGGQCCYIKKPSVYKHVEIPTIPSWDQVMKGYISEQIFQKMSTRGTSYLDQVNLGTGVFNMPIQDTSDRVMVMAYALSMDTENFYSAGFQPIGPMEVLLCR